MQTDILLYIAAGILFLVGITGCIVPGLPGTPLCWCGMLVASFARSCNLPWTVLAVCAVITVVAEVVNNFVPALFAGRAGGSKEASVGAVIGCFAGLLGLGVGMFAGVFLGAFIGEMVHTGGTRIRHGLYVAAWSFLGFITGVGLRLLTAAAFIIVTAQAAFGILRP